MQSRCQPRRDSSSSWCPSLLLSEKCNHEDSKTRRTSSTRKHPLRAFGPSWLRLVSLVECLLEFSTEPLRSHPTAQACAAGTRVVAARESQSRACCE